MAINRQKIFFFSSTSLQTSLPVCRYRILRIASSVLLHIYLIPSGPSSKDVTELFKKCYWLSSKKPLLFTHAKGQISSGSEALLKDLTWNRRITDDCFRAGKYIRHTLHDYNQNRALMCPQNSTTSFPSITLDHFSKQTGFLSSKYLKEFLLFSVSNNFLPFHILLMPAQTASVLWKNLQFDFNCGFCCFCGVLLVLLVFCVLFLSRIILISSAAPRLVLSFLISSDSHGNCMCMPQRQLQHSLQLAKRSLI